MCTRAALLASLVGTVWGCGSLEKPCEDMNHKLNEGEKLTKTVTCHNHGLWPQIFQGKISTTGDADTLNLTIYSVQGDKTTTLVEPTQLSSSAPWTFPADPSKCQPLETCYMGKSSNHINVDIVCVTKGGCEVDVSLSSGCGNSGPPVNCVFTQWTKCVGHGHCYHHRFEGQNWNGGTECDGPLEEECACPGVPPTPSPPGHDTNSPTPSPTHNPEKGTKSPTHPGDTNAPESKTLSPSSSPAAPSSSSKLPIIIGAAAGGAVVLGAIIGGAVWYLKCRKPGGESEGLMNESPEGA